MATQPPRVTRSNPMVRISLVLQALPAYPESIRVWLNAEAEEYSTDEGNNNNYLSCQLPC